MKVLDYLLSAKVFESGVSGYMARRAGDGVVQHRESWGEDYPDKIFYVIRRPNMWGLMSILTVYIQHIWYARRRNWIPVIDMENAPNLYLEDEAVGKGINTWEWYFEQPMGYSMKDIAHARNIVFCNGNLYTSSQNAYQIDYLTMVNNNKQEQWRKLARKYYRMKPDVMEEIAKKKEQMFSGGGKGLWACIAGGRIIQI